jgi:mRNA interferase RelE/StbE
MSEGAGEDGEDVWRVEYARRAEKDIARLDAPIRRRVIAALGELAADPHGRQLRKLAGREGWRLRVGDWRVLLKLDENAQAIGVQRVLPRGRAYER